MKVIFASLALTLMSGTAMAQSDGSYYNLHVNGHLNTSYCASSASPSVCAGAIAGAVAVPTGSNPTLVVDTTAVTANSQIILTPDEGLGTLLGITCNSTVTTQGPLIVTARSAGTSFTVQVDATVGTNKVCLSYLIIN